MSSGFKLCDVSISGILVRPNGMSMSDFAGLKVWGDGIIC